MADDKKRATELWRQFHQKEKPDHIRTLEGRAATWPNEWVCVGRPETIYYNSDKWYKDGRRYNYYHNHTAKVRVWHPADSPVLKALSKDQRASDQKFPVKGDFPHAITVLGDCLGWDLARVDGSGLIFAEPDDGELLCALPGQAALVSVHPRKGVSAVIGGPGLRVEPRGIVG